MTHERTKLCITLIYISVLYRITFINLFITIFHSVDHPSSSSLLPLAADRAKAIKTKATVNESPTDKLIRELKEEIARLKQGGATAGGGDGE